MRIDTFVVVAACSASMAAWPSPQAQYDSVKALGALNGVALACRQVDQVRRMKAAVVANAPKERSFGLAFDEATNQAFLDFVNQHRPCPGPETLRRRVDAAVSGLAQPFPPGGQHPDSNADRR